jgi:CzcA family heavy metal efflux pump
MWIVRLALRRPYTFIVAALLILILSPIMILRTPTDIFPNINIPAVAIVWQYTGMTPTEFTGRITAVFERTVPTTVNDIDHIESQTMNGVSVTKVFFQPKASLDKAIAQVTAIAQTMTKQMPVGITPPLVISYNASSVPILQLSLSGQGLTEQQLNDFAMNSIRPMLADVPGAAIPWPYGGKVRQITIDIDPRKLNGLGLSPNDVLNALSAQNIVLPTGTVKIGDREYNVGLNNSPGIVEELGHLPIKTVNGVVVFIRDVANVRDGFQVQTNVVRQDGRRGSLLSVYKTGNASTLDIVSRVKAELPQIAATLTSALRIQPLFDQSIFVRAAVDGVIREAIIAGCLTAVMILLFLGSWRNTLVIAISIPLSILTALGVLSALGETINIMTLGGLALAVGILVDDATVEVENIHRNRAMGKELTTAILDGAQEIAVPAFVATLCICIVFVPMFLLTGVARYLFTPLAEAVVFAMLASYILSRTLVPTLVMYLLRDQPVTAHGMDARPPKTFFGRWQHAFEEKFDALRERYSGLLEGALRLRWRFVGLFLAVCLGSLLLLLSLGAEFFPSVDAGQIRLHMRAPTGTRIEETARMADLVEQEIRKSIPADELTGILDNIGLPYSGINIVYSNNGTMGNADAEILVSLNAERHHPTAGYISKLRAELPKKFPGQEFFFQPADIVSQILNFGIAAPIDIAFTGNNVPANFAVAQKALEKIKKIPGAVDAHIFQLLDQPRLQLDVDRAKASQLGLAERDVANSVLVALSSSSQVSPTYWLSAANGVNYNLAVQTPQYQLDNLQDLYDLPLTGANGPTNQLMANVATLHREREPAIVTRYNVQPTLNIYVSVQGRDLGGVAAQIQKIVDDARKDLPRGSTVTIRGQAQTMRSSFLGLAGGFVFAVVLVYLLIVVNFQSWLDPFIVITALPGALAGIAWMLFVTGTPLSVPALMGAIMCVGVATANSILVISFAREQLAEHGDAVRAAFDAGYTRMRPVIMTAMAMIIGMVPMSLGLGEGGEQNAPLGRAVIGGLLMATVATLFFVPTVFSLIHGRRKKAPGNEKSPAAESSHLHELVGADS